MSSFLTKLTWHDRLLNGMIKRWRPKTRLQPYANCLTANNLEGQVMILLFAISIKCNNLSELCRLTSHSETISEKLYFKLPNWRTRVIFCSYEVIAIKDSIKLYPKAWLMSSGEGMQVWHDLFGGFSWCWNVIRCGRFGDCKERWRPCPSDVNQVDGRFASTNCYREQLSLCNTAVSSPKAGA